jgi:hypothetical protein
MSNPTDFARPGVKATDSRRLFSKLIDFVRLDFITVKPYFTVKNLVIYAACALLLAVTSGNVASAIGVGMMLGTLFVGYPFALGEKCNIDTLYSTLALDRGSVVSGRYVFTLMVNLCAVVFSAGLSTVGLFVAGVFKSAGALGTDAFWSTLALSVVFIVVQAIQLPIYFRLGYTRARFVSLLPFAFIMALASVLMAMGRSGKYTSMITDFFVSLVSGGGNGGSLMALSVVVSLCLIVLVSYGLSLAFYRKREF